MSSDDSGGTHFLQISEKIISICIGHINGRTISSNKYLLVGVAVDVAPVATLRLEAPPLVGADIVDAALIGVRRPFGVEVSILGMARGKRPFRQEAFLLLTTEEGRVPG